MVRTFVDAIVERGEAPFDAAWMRSAHERFWERHRFIEQFNNTLLEPLTPAGRDLLIAQYGSDARPGNDSPQQRLADLFFENFNDPRLLTEAFHDRDKARAVIKQHFGSSLRPILRGGAGIACPRRAPASSTSLTRSSVSGTFLVRGSGFGPTSTSISRRCAGTRRGGGGPAPRSGAS